MNSKVQSFVCLSALLVSVFVVAFISGGDPPATVEPGHTWATRATHPSASESTVAAPQESVRIATLDEVLVLAEQILDVLRSDVDDYTATLVKRERIHGRLGSESRMQVKVRNPTRVGEQEKGLAVYLRFEEPGSASGREVIWVENENNSRLVSHEGGLKNIMRMTLAPDSSLAMLGNKYPITEIGLVRLVEKLIEKAKSELGSASGDLTECRVEIIDNQLVGDRPCRLIQVIQPREGRGLDFHIAHIFVDMERMIPLRYAAFLWPKDPSEAPPLEEEYTYLDVELNVGLADKDFDPDNPAYQFPSF
jgi:hypothetical protein